MMMMMVIDDDDDGRRPSQAKMTKTSYHSGWGVYEDS